MRFIGRKEAAEEEGESYFVSMTDMMVGIIFIFIIMLSFFALQYRSTTASLTKAKDSQTSLLLETAKNLEKQQATVEIDRVQHILCVPSTLLVPGDAGERRCFPFSGEPKVAQSKPKSDEERKTVVKFIALDTSTTEVKASTSDGGISYPADQLFDSGSANLSANGRQVAQSLAQSLAARLPCYGYGAPPSGPCGAGKMTVVNIVASASFDAFTEAGREAAALALRRSVAFHDALVSSQPVLGRLTNSPAGQPGAQPLLRVASIGQSQMAAPPAGQGQTISIQFEMAPSSP